MTPELQQYIDACRAHGMDEAAIRAALIQSGWTAEQLAVAWPAAHVATPPTPPLVPTQVATPPLHVQHAVQHEEQAVFHVATERKPKKWVLLSLIALGVLVVVCGTGIALGEAGYAPTISKLYRRTGLPFLWHGTTSNAAIGIAQGLSSTVQQRPLKGTMSFKGTYTVSPTGDAKLGFVLPPTPKGTLADASSSQSQPFDFTLSLSVDPNTGVAANLTSNVSFPPEADQYINPTFKQLTADVVLPNTGKTFFWHTNALPVPTAADKDRWFAETLDSVTDLDSTRQEVVKDLTGDNATLKAVMKAVNSLTVDKGVVRHNGSAQAQYEMVLTPEKAKSLGNDTSLTQDVRDFFTSFADGWTTGNLTIDWYMTPRHPQLTEIAAHLNSMGDAYGSLTADVTVTFAYGASAAVTVPDGTKAWDSFDSYLQAVQAAYPNLADNGIFSQEALDFYFGGGEANSIVGAEYHALNAGRESDATEVAQAIENWKTTKGTEAPPVTTNGVYDNLTVAGCLLCAVPDIPITLPLQTYDFDPDHYVSYWSDGTHYRVVAPLIDANKQITSYYVIEDGISSTLDTLP